MTGQISLTTPATRLAANSPGRLYYSVHTIESQPPELPDSSPRTKNPPTYNKIGGNNSSFARAIQLEALEGRAFNLNALALLGEELDDGNQDHRTKQRSQEGEEHSSTLNIHTEEGEDPTTQKTTNNTNHDVQEGALLSVRALNHGGNPSG